MSYKEPFIRLLPRSWRFVALGILVVTVIYFILCAFDKIIMERDVIFTITQTGVLISLLMFALLKHKRENEVIAQIRLKVFASTLVFGVCFVIVEPFVNWVFQDGFVSDMEVGQVLFTLFIFYFIYFWGMVRKV